MEKRIITTAAIETDNEIELNLRPNTLDDYIGQDKVKNNLKVFIEAAKRIKEPLDHVLLYGPPGLGKTTLSLSLIHILLNYLLFFTKSLNLIKIIIL